MKHTVSKRNGDVVEFDLEKIKNAIVNSNSETEEMGLNDLHLHAWEQGIKTLYYQHGTNSAQKLFQSNVCLACEA